MSIAACQVCPYSDGVVTRCIRLALNVKVPTTMAIDKTVPTSALRTGTAPRPAPGSSASRMPSEAVTGAPLLESRANHLPRVAAARRSAPWSAPELSRHDGTATAAIRATTMPMRPMPSTTPSTSMPGLGSASRACGRVA